jgi:Icc-related predicted phosphoesterase
MKSRDKLDRHWERSIDDDVDILITHTPPKGILDVSEDRDGKLEYCGCKALKRHVITRIKPKLMLFGHIHSNEINENNGILYRNNVYFSNASVVTDNKFGKLSSNGNIFEVDDNKNIKIC